MHTSGLFRALIALAAATAGTSLSAQAPARAASTSIPAAMSAIREANLKRGLFAFASDGLHGRKAGTVDEMRASVWGPSSCTRSA